MAGSTPIGTYLFGHLATLASVPMAIAAFAVATGVGAIVTRTWTTVTGSAGPPWAPR
jgi:hypothetical protein